MDHKAISFKSEDIEGRVFTGYASTYDLDQGGDIIERGAFTKTLTERGQDIKILWQHNEPIGKPIKMYEDDKGLYIEAKISNTVLGNEALELMRDGVIDQMSIGYSVPQGKADYRDGVRYIKELKLYEASLVTFPMNEAARITGLKNQITEAVKAGEMDKEIIQHLIAELKALFDTQPVDTTEPLVKQPPELDGLKSLMLNFGKQ